MQSSFVANNYADVFKAIVSAFQPTLCVELGVLEGYSSIAIAEGLKMNFQKGGAGGHLKAYDLFEDYPYCHSTMERVLENYESIGVKDWISLHKAEAFEVHERFDFNSVHLLHVDLSNTGETVRKIMKLWDDRMVLGGIILFEGGSEERDEVEWMRKYDGPSIQEELESNLIIAERYVFGTYFKFPSLTCLLKKR